jgi:myosin-5
MEQTKKEWRLFCHAYLTCNFFSFFLLQAAILYNLKARHVQSLPYTRTGDIILACNPYQWFHHLYSEDVRNHYSQALVWNVTTRQQSPSSTPPRPPKKSPAAAAQTPSKTSGTGNDPRTALAPHVYETSCLAYKGLLRDEEDQSILVSGESGAGKTETVKILLRNLASVQEGARGSPSSTSTTPQDNITVKRVLDSNPLLEAFGNATTLRNDNSSRFGKYLQLQFDTTYSSSSAPAILAGSKCEVYLLEKSRVTHHHVSERSYHIFYQLLAAPEELKVAIWDGLADTDVESFCYVGVTESDSPSATQGIIEGKTDAERFQLTLQALELIGVRGEILQMLLRAICVVLQLGNLEFSPAQPQDATGMMALGIHHRPGRAAGDDGDHDASVISSVEELQELSELMGMSDLEESGDDKISKALQKALTVRNVEARGEVFAVPLTPEKAKESADAFAKEIYAKTFLWLVRTINDATCAEKNYHRDAKTTAKPPANYGIIGLLDVFGFETFEVNRFEQLCINYCNEKLQQKFTQDIFRSVQVEYENEGIELEEITYDDNTDVLDLVEGRMGLLAFLNEECVRPKGSDKTFVYKAQAMNKENPCFFRDKHAQDTEFGICHYAGKVVYDATDFVVKNTDTLPSDLLECAKLSSNAIIARELTNDDMMNPLHVNSATASAPTKKKKRPKSLQSSASSHPHQLQKRTSNIVAETVWTKFKNQLSRLMDTLSETKTRYIRCIKPNSQKAPLLMEHVSTVEQLRCAGVVAAVTISRSAFPNRLEHLSVLDRFKSLWPKGDHIAVLQDNDLDPEEKRRKATEILLTLALKEMEFEKSGSNFRAFVMGKTRAYFRAGALEFLEAERLKHLGTYATVLQSAARGFVLRSKYQRHRHATIVLQSNYFRIQQQRRYLELRRAAIRVECWYRVIFAARTVYHLRRTIRATTIQTRWRIYRDTHRLKAVVAASVVIQAMVRGSLQRPKYEQALIDKKEEAKLENQLAALQKKLEEAEAKRLEAEKQAEERAVAAVEQYKDQVASPENDEAQDEPPIKPVESKEDVESVAQNIVQEFTAEQQRLMDESGKMLESLRKEVFKLRSQNQQLKTDFDLLKDNNQRLMDANASAGASFAALNQHAKQLSKQNANLVNEVQSLKGQIHKLNIQQVELKDELRFKTATYVAEVQSRLNFQKALQKITDLISETCRDHRLVEKVLTVADEVEMDYMAGTGGSNPSPPEDDMENTGNSSRGILSYFFS